MSDVAEALAKLEARVSKIKFDDEIDLCTFIALSSRMKALGESKYFDMIPEICNRDIYRGQVDEIIQSNADRGIWDIKEHEGDESALDIIEAQDWYCFREFNKESGLFDVNTDALIDHWIAEANQKILDVEALAYLMDWICVYPIPEDLRIPVIENALLSGILISLKAESSEQEVFDE